MQALILTTDPTNRIAEVLSLLQVKEKQKSLLERLFNSCLERYSILG